MGGMSRVYAFIDSQNLNLGVSRDVVTQAGRVLYAGRKLDFKKFHDYLRTKFGVSKAFLFIGRVPGNEPLYNKLKSYGYELILKETSAYLDSDGKWVVKGNVDTDIVLYACHFVADEYDEAIFVSGDGDFTSLYDALDAGGKLKRILVPNQYAYSKLLRKYRSRITFVSTLHGLYRGKGLKK
jgi:uncharacterized LabA/DUF88 family protein